MFEKGGFDCLLGNPPWEKINLEDKEFFAIRKPAISEIKNASKRNKAIQALKQAEPALFQEYADAIDFTNKQIAFFKESGSYKFGNEGLLNTYPLFTEKVGEILNADGACGYIIPSGFFMDDTTSPLFRHYFQSNRLKSIYDFENRKKIFQHVDSRYRFSVVTIAKQNEKEKAQFLFFLQNIEDIPFNPNAIYLGFDELKLFNPNNQLMPAFKNQFEVDINRKLYRFGVLRADGDLTSTAHVHRMINISTESGSLHAYSGEGLLRVYESKFIHQYDHRFATALENSDQVVYCTNSQKSNLDFEITPKSYAPESLAKEKGTKWKWGKKWYLAYRVISRSTDARTSIATIIPQSVVSNSAFLIFIDEPEDLLLHLANMNTFCFDFAVRAKVTLNFPPVILEQCPCIKSKQISEQVLSEIRERALKLSYTAHDLDGFGKDFGIEKPFIWNDKERFQLQCELDAIYAHLYGLEKEEMDYILETFPIVKRKDIDKYGNYRTKETIFGLYDEFAWVREGMKATK